MQTLNALQEKLRRRLIDLDGQVSRHDLEDLIEEARTLGLDDAQIARLVPEADRDINWDQIRTEKEQAAALAQEDAARKLERQRQIDAAPEYLDALLSYALAEGVLEAATLRGIFQKANELEQDADALAARFKTVLTRRKFKPHPGVNLVADGLPAVLASTNWYSPKMHPAAAAPEEPVRDALPKPVQIVSFYADKLNVRKGGVVNLYWNVTGEGRVHISHCGGTDRLQGTHAVRPEGTTRYTLTAGTAQRSVEVVVAAPSWRKRFRRAFWWAVGGMLLLWLLVAAVPDRGPAPVPNPAGTVVEAAPTGPLEAGQIGAVGLDDAEEAAVVAAMNQYLRLQGETDASPTAVNALYACYAFPMPRYFSEQHADWGFVYNDIRRYRRNYEFDAWALDPAATSVEKRSDGTYQVDLAGPFSYYIRTRKRHAGYRKRYVRQRCILDSDYRIRSVYALD